MDEEAAEQWFETAPTQNQGFTPAEMLACGKCGRLSPPTKRKCLYCAAELEISAAQSHLLRPHLRKLEAWEKGFNVILKPLAEVPDEEKIAEMARFLKIEKEILRKIIAAGTALPVARAESEREAEITLKWLENFAVESIILSDEQLNVGKLPIRLRGIEFFDDNLILRLFNRDEIVRLPKNDLALIVTGAFFERKIEATENRQKKGANKIIDSTETASDGAVIDIYSRTDDIGYRISAQGFDFSCLENDKQLLAKDNIKTLAEKIKEFAARAESVGNYLQVRECLATIWEVDQKTESHGLKRGGIGKFNTGSITTVNNLSQFTKYSRLQQHIL